MVSGVYDRAFRPIGVTASQMNILVALAEQGGAKPTAICGLLQMDKSTLCRNVQGMQRRGWVRAAQTADARSHRLELTGKGLGLIEQALPIWREAQMQARALLGSPVADHLLLAEIPPESVPADAPETPPGDTQETATEVSLEVTPRALPDAGQGIFFWE